MKIIIAVAFALVAVALAAPPGQADENEGTQIVRNAYDQKPDGGYTFEVETSDGTVREETGELKEVLNEEQKPQKVIIVRGSYSYRDPLGNLVKIVYIGDENGYQAEGDSIPTSPPVARR